MTNLTTPTKVYIKCDSVFRHGLSLADQMVFDDWLLNMKPSSHILYHENLFSEIFLYHRITYFQRWQHGFQETKKRFVHSFLAGVSYLVFGLQCNVPSLSHEYVFQYRNGSRFLKYWFPNQLFSTQDGPISRNGSEELL